MPENGENLENQNTIQEGAPTTPVEAQPVAPVQPTAPVAPATPIAPTQPAVQPTLVAQPVQPTPITVGADKENVPMGIVGAILGSLLGCLAIVLLDSMGFVAAISGVVMAAGTLKMYEKFAKKMSKTGIIICVIVMLVMTLLAANVATSLRVVQELKEYGITVEFSDIFTNLYTYISKDMIDGGVYFGNLALIYVFNAIGAFGILKTSAANNKQPKATQPTQNA